MSDPIAVRLGDELRERFDAVHERRSGDDKESDTFRYLLDAGLHAEETPVFARIDLPDRYAARVEAERDVGESDEELLRRLLRDTVDGWDEDVLDEIGASDELRAAVEGHREDGESLDGAVERLLRAGVEADTSGPDLKERAAIGVGVAMIGLTFVAAYARYGLVAPLLGAVATLAYLTAYPTIDAAAMRALDVARRVRG